MGRHYGVRALATTASPTLIALSSAVAIVLVVAGSIFGLHGEQWSWWRSASWAGALVVTGAAVLMAASCPTVGRRLRDIAWPAGVWLGTGLVAVGTAVMADRYGDPYGGPLLWPHALAVVALLGLLVADAGVVVRGLPGGDQPRRT